MGVLSFTFSLIGRLGHLLWHSGTHWYGGWETFLNCDILTFFIILVLGHWNFLVFAPLLRYVVADLKLGGNIMTNLDRGI